MCYRHLATSRLRLFLFVFSLALSGLVAVCHPVSAAYAGDAPAAPSAHLMHLDGSPGQVLKSADSDTVTVTLDYNGHAKTWPEEKVVQKGSKVLLETPQLNEEGWMRDPDGEHYYAFEFTGWYFDRELTRKVEGSTITPTESVTLYAGWANVYVTHFANCAMSPRWKLVRSDEGLNLATFVPYKTDPDGLDDDDNYKFAGWYLDSALSQKAPARYYPTEEATLYAKWDVKIHNMSGVNVEYLDYDKEYTGNPIKQDQLSLFRYRQGGYSFDYLKPGVDFEAQYSNNVNVGTATITFVGKGRYVGSTSFTFKIVPASISKATVTGIVGKNYSGKAVTQNPTVKLTMSDGTVRTLKNGTDYTVAYKNNVAAGTATMTFTGKGNYKGTLVKTFNIKQIWHRLSGGKALDTMRRITGKFGTAKTAVVASNAGFRDSLAAVGLAGSLGAPLLTTSKARLSDQTRAELIRMGVTTVYIVGGTADVSANTEKYIKALPKVKTVKRITGASASAKAIAAAKQIKKPSDTVIVVTQNSFQDALSIGPYAYATKSPVLFAERNKKLSRETMDYIKLVKFKKAIIVGGPVALPASVENQLKSAGIAAGSITRLAGSNQYNTSRIIAEWAMGRLPNGSTAGKGTFYRYATVRFQPSVKLGANNAGVARGDAGDNAWKDALAGMALCGKNRSILLLMDDTNYVNRSVTAASKLQIKNGYVFGGELAVGRATWNALNASTA